MMFCMASLNLFIKVFQLQEIGSSSKTHSLVLVNRSDWTSKKMLWFLFLFFSWMKEGGGGGGGVGLEVNNKG